MDGLYSDFIIVIDIVFCIICKFMHPCGRYPYINHNWFGVEFHQICEFCIKLKETCWTALREFGFFKDRIDLIPNRSIKQLHQTESTLVQCKYLCRLLSFSRRISISLGFLILVLSVLRSS